MITNAVSNVPSAEPGDEPGPLAGGGEPPYDGGMDKRLTVLETRFDTILPTLLTQAEFYRVMGDFRGEIRVDMEKMRGELHADMERLHGELHTDMERRHGELHTDMERRHRELHTDMERRHGETRSEMATMRGELRAEMQEMRGEFGIQMEKLRADVHAVFVSALKWVVGLTITLILGMAALGVSMSNTMRMVATQYERASTAALPPVTAPGSPVGDRR